MRISTLLVGFCLLLAGIPSAVFAHGAATGPSGGGAGFISSANGATGSGILSEAAALGSEAAVGRDDGLYTVTIDPELTLSTHGPDPKPTRVPGYATQLLRGFDDLAGNGTILDGTTPKRPVFCADDGYRLKLLYAHLGSRPNELDSKRELITSMIERTNYFLNSEAINSGGDGADFKFICGDDARPSAESFTTDSNKFEGVVDAARASGFDSGQTDYVIFLDADLSGYCGVGSYSFDDRLQIDNANNYGGDYAMIYRSCWQNSTVLHEIGHTEGAVQAEAPHSTGSGSHCNEGGDVMCYAPDGGDRHQTMIQGCSGQGLFFDCGYDDYFDAAPEPGEYLLNHWNIGSPLNRMLRFAGSPPPVPPHYRTVRLRFGRPFHGRAAGAGESRRFAVRVPRYTRRISFSLAPSPACSDIAGCGVELALRARSRRFVQSCSSDRAGYFRERCRVRRPHRGRWLIDVTTKSGSGQISLLVTRRR